MEREPAIEALHRCIQTRPRPEDVAELVLDVLGDRLAPRERAVIAKAAQRSLRRGAWSYSSMASDFLRPVGAERQVHKACELFAVPSPPSAADCLDAARVDAFVRAISTQIHRAHGETNFLHDRLDRAERRAAGLDMGHRRYNKRWRLLKRFEDKIARMLRNTRKYELTRVGKSALATRLTQADIARDLDTACFVAYLASRMSLRSVFTNQGQDRPYDEVSEVLYRRAAASPAANFWAMAHVHPEREVLARLGDEERGRLVGATFAILKDAGDLLEAVWRETKIDRATLIVRRGNDSSTWNQTAGAWNKARDLWLSLLAAMGMEDMLEIFCPGKVLRLMAADVASWHRSSGGGLHPDTPVWAELPAPWEVLDGRAPCPRATVEAVCQRHGVDPAGWTGPRRPRTAVPFRPTPELVHGVAVSSPALATLLRKAGWFSGKGASPVDGDVVVRRDHHGAALAVDGAPPTDVD